MSAQIAYKLQPVPFTAVAIDDAFWSPRLETNRTVTIPYDFKKCEETGRISNFEKAAGWREGPHEGIFYNDSDVFKIIEGAAYSLNIHPDPSLDRYLDDLIAKIAAAQEPDGYLYTARTIAERNGTVDALPDDREGKTRWSNLRVSHELYNVGHLYEAAVAHYRSTGKRTLLDVALKNADLVASVFGPGKRHDVPGHQEIEMGLVKLYQVTGEARYLRLAHFFLDERGHARGRALYANHDNPGYMQDHLPVVEQTEAVGHAVRAGYMYCGMADVAALTGHAAYIAALDRLWENVVGRKLYLTGGIGARHRGEAFGEDYELPNLTAYAETCAAIANAMWNFRMFLLHGDAKYLDVLERTIYNGFLSGIALTGDRFFYVNPLAFDGKFAFNRRALSREPWFDCSCCPSNVVRFLPSLPGYVYAHDGDNLYVNLYLGNHATVAMEPGPVQIRQTTGYPWSGEISLSMEPAQPQEFTLYLRIPGWARAQPVPSDLYRYVDGFTEQPALAVNGEPVTLALERGFARLRRRWQPGDVVTLHLPMPVRRVAGHPNVADNIGRVAFERGPLVYCAEWVDNSGSLEAHRVPDGVVFEPVWRDDILQGLMALRGDTGDRTLTLIPYHLWAHRGVGEMAVWLPRAG
ncbi:MAG TPA: glycoside hydrolase family 127 protein [Caldilineaceae bacterium]|nr:glycoside hydrolase family 127 protein [Caldilineaceae bacterium]